MALHVLCVFLLSTRVGPGTGVPFHVHGPTFAETIYGRKVHVFGKWSCVTNMQVIDVLVFISIAYTACRCMVVMSVLHLTELKLSTKINTYTKISIFFKTLLFQIRLGHHWSVSHVYFTLSSLQRWFFYPPEWRPQFDPDMSSLQWLLLTYPSLPLDARPPSECVLQPGEVRGVYRCLWLI